MLQRGAILSGKYRIDGVLGEGGMAVVYAVTHLRNTARLAVKVLHEGSVLKNHIRARFVREGKVANSVNHPGAVQMIDDGVAEDGAPYLVMEHLNGVSVDQLASHAIPLCAALNIAYQVLDVLRAAHDNGIIHRDIKPANLFVLKNGRVKVLDFGISRLHDGAEPFDSQATGSVMGTPFFMAPEQARADASEIDTRTDLFALGATLFTLLSGEYLHTGDDARRVVLRAATQQARSLASVAPGAARAVVDLVDRAVAYDPAARWESAEAMQAAVRQVHEALCGPIEFEPLATLVLVREFRRKSHARLTASLSAVPWVSSHAEPSPLSTTLPAVAGATRSVKSFRPAPDSSAEARAASSHISEPSELAGWTGQVPGSTPASTRARRVGSRFGLPLGKSRALQIGVLAISVAAGLLGFARLRTPPHTVAAKAPLTTDVSSRNHGPDAIKTETALYLAPAPVLGVAPRDPRSSRAPAPPKATPPPKPESAPKPLTTSEAMPAERLKIAPTLIRLPDHSEP